MTDKDLISSALEEAYVALEILRRVEPPDPVARRKQMAQAAKAFNRAARHLTEWEYGVPA